MCVGGGVHKQSCVCLFQYALYDYVYCFLFVYVLLICMWVFVHCMLFFDEVLKCFESLKVLYKFPLIIIIINIMVIWSDTSECTADKRVNVLSPVVLCLFVMNRL